MDDLVAELRAIDEDDQRYNRCLDVFRLDFKPFPCNFHAIPMQFQGFSRLKSWFRAVAFQGLG